MSVRTHLDNLPSQIYVCSAGDLATIMQQLQEVESSARQLDSTIAGIQQKKKKTRYEGYLDCKRYEQISRVDCCSDLTN